MAAWLTQQTSTGRLYMRPPEEIKRDLVQRWLEKAQKDFDLAKDLVSENKPYLEAVGFHSQQAAEKFLKAYLVCFQIEFPKTNEPDFIRKTEIASS